MPATRTDFAAHVLDRIAQVWRNLGIDAVRPVTAGARFADLLDSMGMVELLGLLADDCGVSPTVLEEQVQRRFGTVAELAAAMRDAGLVLLVGADAQFTGALRAARNRLHTPRETAWLAGVTSRLPARVQSSADLDGLLGRPAGWLEAHAGIRSRRVWGDEDPLEVASEAARNCLEQCGLLREEVGALLVTSEAPPLLAGLAASLHHRLELAPSAVALEIGGACTGFLAALWLGRALLPRVGPALILTVETPSRYLHVRPGAAGEAAALFGDGVAAALLTSDSPAGDSVPLLDATLACHGEAADLIRVEPGRMNGVEVRMQGRPLGSRAVRAMTEAVRDLARDHGLSVSDLEGIVVHGGNGRLPALVARQLGMAADKVWSLTCETGNLGSASLPAAWAARPSLPAGPVVWTAVGAGLTTAAALTGPARKK